LGIKHTNAVMHPRCWKRRTGIKQISYDCWGIIQTWQLPAKQTEIPGVLNKTDGRQTDVYSRSRVLAVTRNLV